jgi:hypothetical protein
LTSNQLTLAFPGNLPIVPGTRRRDWPGVTFYASGTNDSGEIRGFASLGIHVGFSASVIGPTALRELERHANTGLLVFGDTGAYGERPAPGPDEDQRGFRTSSRTREITDADWDARLDVFERVARIFGDRFSVVTPDRVGAQEATLARIETYAPRIRRIARFGARILLPLHAGLQDLPAFCTKAEAILSLPLVPAFPLPKGRTTVRALMGFARSQQPRVIHLLGLGLRSRWARHVFPALARQLPGLHVSMDANLITSAVGRRSNGTAARPLTAAQDEIRQRGYPHAFGETADPSWGIRADYTDSVSSPSTWLGPSASRGIASTVGLSSIQAARWRRDPDSFLQEPITPHSDAPSWWEHPAMEAALEEAWIKHLHRLHTAPRKAEAIVVAFRSHPAAGQFGSTGIRRAA